MSTALIVDDERDTNDILSSLVHSQGFTPIQLFGGEGVREAVRKHSPEVVLLDLMLPDIDGFQVCDQIRKHPETCLTPVVMVTALADHLHFNHGYRVGTNEYLSKPFTPDSLFKSIDEARAWPKLLKPERRTLTTIEIGLSIYPLIAPIEVIFHEEISFSLTCKAFGDLFQGKGDRFNRAYEDWRDQIHIAFQRALFKRPFEMTGEDLACWEALHKVIDVKAYKDSTPQCSLETGLVEIDTPGSFVIKWWPSGRREKVDLALMPPEFASFPRGQWFEAVVERLPRISTICRAVYVQTVDPIEPMVDNDLYNYWEAMKSTRELPESNRKWTTS
jgi:CheY-like chemotaxis protein